MILILRCLLVGTGKTTLMYEGTPPVTSEVRHIDTHNSSLVIDSFLDDLEPRQSSPVIFFYCDPPLDADQAHHPWG